MTFSPVLAAASASEAASVVFPAPPFWVRNAMLRIKPTFGSSCARHRRANAWLAAGAVGKPPPELRTQNAKQIRLIAFVALMREQDLQPFPRDWRRAAAKPVKEVHAAFRPNSLLKIPRLSLGTCIAMVSPLSRRAASK